MEHVLRLDLLNNEDLSKIVGSDYFLDHEEMILNRYGYNDTHDKYERVIR